MRQPVPLDINNLPVGDNPQVQNEYPKGSQYNTEMSNQFNNQNYGYGMNNGNINQNMNEIVRNQLMSRGVHVGRNNSPYYIKQQDQERKKILLENIQTQMGLAKNTKLKELQRKRQEDEQYLKDMVNSFPFGRGGGGAPIRDKNGQIVATRRALISDPKYNLVSINVDDDYNDVWGKDKRFGLVNFKNKTMNLQNFKNEYSNYLNNQNNMMNNNIDYIQNSNRFSNSMPRNMSARQFTSQPTNIQPPLYNEYDNSNYNQMPPNQFNDYNNNMNYNNQYEQRPYSTNPRANNMNMMNQYQEMPMENNMQVINNNPPMMNQPPMNTQYNNPNIDGINPNIDNAELNLSYDNYGLDEDAKRRNKELYRNDLLSQIKERENRKLLEKQRKEREDAEEEERLRRENEEIERRLAEERARKNKLDQIKVGNNKDVVVDNRKEETTTTVKNVQSNVNEQENLFKLNQQEIESRMALNNEILKLRDQMQDQQVNLFNQINSLKQETQNANMQRFEALKEIEKLKDELSKQRADEELRRKYVYDVIADDNSKVSNIYSQTHLPDAQIDKVILPVQDPKTVYYDARIRHPNKILPLPSLNELKDDQMPTDSKFIDLDTHNVVGGLEVYEPKVNQSSESKDEELKINNKGYSVDGEFGTLRSYYDYPGGSGGLIRTEEQLKNSSDMDTKFNNDVKVDVANNVNEIEDGHLEVNQIYNKNLERLRMLNDIEGKVNSLYSGGNDKQYKTADKLAESKDNYDDFISKINNTCTPNY